MRKVFCFLLTVLISNAANAQYFYQDIYSTRKAEAEHALMEKSEVKKVTIKSLDGNGEPNAGFLCEKSMDDHFRRVISMTKSDQTGTSFVITLFNDQGHLVRSVDSSASSFNITDYRYDSLGRVREILFSSSADTGSDRSNFNESHIYDYGSKGQLVQMIRSKSGKPFSVVNFTADSAGHIIEEQENATGDTIPPIFYKYDDNARITDIYRFNPSSGRMLANKMFDYDDQGRLLEMTAVSTDTQDFTTWKYDYNEKGLVAKEEVFDRDHELLGYVQYEYSFRL